MLINALFLFYIYNVPVDYVCNQPNGSRFLKYSESGI